MILYSGDCVSVTILPDFSSRISGGKLCVARRALIMASAASLPRSEAHPPQLLKQGPHSIGFSGGQLSSYVEGSSALDFPWIHDARPQDQSQNKTNNIKRL